MTIRTHRLPSLAPFLRAVLALAIVAAALAAAGPAAAEPKIPVDENGKKSCPVAYVPKSGVGYAPHGTIIVFKTFDGKTTDKYICDDGEWKQVYAFERPRQSVLTEVTVDTDRFGLATLLVAE
jgi:hypothetical protein